MALVVAQRLSTVLGWTTQHAGRRAASWSCARRNLAPQEGAHLYVSRMPSAVITTSVGGHPARSESNLPVTRLAGTRCAPAQFMSRAVRPRETAIRAAFLIVRSHQGLV